MTKMIGKNENTNDEATTFIVSVSSVTATPIIAAVVKSLGETPEIEANVTNKGSKALWLRKYAAATDNIKQGIRIPPGETRTVIQNGDVYTGAWSAIFDSGPDRDISVEVY